MNVSVMNEDINSYAERSWINNSAAVVTLKNKDQKLVPKEHIQTPTENIYL